MLRRNTRVTTMSFGIQDSMIEQFVTALFPPELRQKAMQEARLAGVRPTRISRSWNVRRAMTETGVFTTFEVVITGAHSWQALYDAGRPFADHMHIPPRPTR